VHVRTLHRLDPTPVRSLDGAPRNVDTAATTRMNEALDARKA
jgi:hypothetical protein